MTNASKDRVTAGQRAGLPLARAQRLTAETQKRARRGGTGVLYGIGIFSVAGLVGFGVMTGQAPDPVQVASLQTSASDAAFDAPTTITASDTVVDAIASVADAPNEFVPEAPVTTSIPIDQNDPACVRSVETRLNSLHEMAVTDVHWSRQQDALSNLVQAALDCSETRLKIVGSIELIGTDMADVRVRWDRNNWTLDLNMIDNIEQQSALASPGITEQAVEFVIR